MNQIKQQQQQQNPQTEHKVTIFIAFSEMENKTKQSLIFIWITNLFQLCDHTKYNHLSQFSCATKQCFNRLQLGNTNNTKNG